MNMDCIFCKIVEGKEPARKVYEDDKVLVFHTLVPEAKTHLLLIPKKHFVRFDELDVETAYALFNTIPKVVKMLNLDHFRIVNKNGYGAGQRVPHLHIHILSGNLPKTILPG